MSNERLVECTTVNGGKITLPASRLVVRPSAYAVIFNAGSVGLVTNIRSGRYYLPGGGVEQGERLVEAVKREIYEEVGLAVRQERLIHFAEDFLYYDPHDAAFHALQFYYACEPMTLTLSSHPEAGDDEGDPQWVPIAQLTAASFHNHGERLLDVIQLAAAA